MNQELKSGLKDRILRSMYNAKNKESEKIEDGLVILSIIGSASPFIGILGMVWSVMNNFHAIASSKSVSLAVIAPTMSEALFVTAVGIFVAIPASMFYNILITKADIIINKIEDFSTEVYTTISRSIDEGKNIIWEWVLM
jgi:biopolymer transport protein TolQ